MDAPFRKVTARIDLTAGNAYLRTQPRSRPGSPTKHMPTSSPSSPSAFHPKVKANNIAIRKPSSTSSLSASHTNAYAPVSSRPCSPLRPSQILTNMPEPRPKVRVTAKPTPRPGTSPVSTNAANPEPRQRSLTAVSTKLRLPPSEDRPRSGSVISLHQAPSIPNLNMSSPTIASQPPPSADLQETNVGRRSTSPAVGPIKIKSKLTGLTKSTSASAGDVASCSLSPTYVATRPIHARARAPSITSSLSLNDPPPATFYPITTASPAANPHRYAPLRAPSPPRSHPSPTLSNESHLSRKSPLVPKVDPTLVPLPPYSPPISAISLSSKSSVSKMSTSLNSDQTADHQAPSIVAHVKHRSMDWSGLPNPLFTQSEIIPQTRRDHSPSKESGPLDQVQSDSDAEFEEGSERQLKAEAKTNRKIADLEITNHSLLAINTSLETMKNRQAKEIRDLRRKLRESRLILPPRAFKAVESDVEEEEEEGDEESDVLDEEADKTFQRVKGLIENLLDSGKRALETRPEDFRASLATKVLNADELRSWRDSGQRSSPRNLCVDKQDADDETLQSHPSPSLVAIPDSSSMTFANGDEKASHPSLLPPITITHSS